ncbi:conserved hypothetical protein [Roseibium sp. TrichSKD4]|uniref:phage tail tip lysozyme n=1 Tax=Roseibium sp. TrichSKD4 TaxID=744980 RepID=UPI0001E5637F|nr:phage tail tip lysozyme [Roseibium sp. TrichSKD4]EFO33897.1 conserved hypothetical protein [Roseibium sp. TrichSKD4]
MARNKMPQVGIRLAAVDGKVVQRELRKFGQEGQEALKRIEKASKPARRSLKAVDAAVSDLKGRSEGLSSNLGAVGAGLKAMGPAGAAAAIGIGALTLGLGSVIRSSKDAARRVAEVGDAARRAGLDVEGFQELQIVADRNRISVDALTDGLKELNLRADEFVFTGKGPASEAFQRLGFGADELKQKLKDPSKLLLEIIDRLQGFDRSARIRIADELFGGTAGERFVELIDVGAKNLRTMIEEARLAGNVFERDLVQKAMEVDSSLKQSALTLDRNLTRALLDAAPAAKDLMEFLAGAARGFSDLVDLTRAVEDQATSRVQGKYNDLLNERVAIQDRLKGLEERDGGRGDQRFASLIQTARHDLEVIDKELQRYQGILDRRNGYDPDFVFGEENDTGEDQKQAYLAEQERARLEKLAQAWIGKVKPAAETYQDALKDIAAAEREGFLSAEQAGDARTRAAKDYQKALEQLNKPASRELEKRLSEVKRLIEASRTPAEELGDRLQRIGELESEGLFARVGGDGNLARVKAMRDYASAADDAATSLLRLEELSHGNGPNAYAAKLYLAERKASDLKEAVSPLRKELADGFADAIVNGEKFSDVLENLAKQILRDFLAGQLNFLFGGAAPNDFLSRLLGSITGRTSGGVTVPALSGAPAQSAANPAFGSVVGLQGARSSIPLTSPAAPSFDGSVASQVWNFFSQKGLKDFQTAAILGHVKAESAFNPLAVGDGGNAFGLFQHNDRRFNLFDFIGGRKNLGNVQGQLNFAWSELMSTEGRAFRALQNSSNLREATAAFGGFERPSGFSWGNPEAMHNWTGRLQAAQDALDTFGGGLSNSASSLTRFDGGVGQAVSSLANSSGSLANTATSFAGESQNLAGSLSRGLQNVFSGLSEAGGGLAGGGLGGGGGFGGFFAGLFKGIGGLFGFQEGGATGPGADNQVKGVVHANEYVFSAPATRRIGVDVLEALHRNTLKGYQAGGFVSSHGPSAFASFASPPVSANENGMRAGAFVAPAAPPVSVVVNNYSKAHVDVEEERDERGGRSIRFIMSEQIADGINMRGGAAQKTLGQDYGLTKKRVKR